MWDSVPRDTVAFKPTNASPALCDMALLVKIPERAISRLRNPLRRELPAHQALKGGYFVFVFVFVCNSVWGVLRVGT